MSSALGPIADAIYYRTNLKTPLLKAILVDFFAFLGESYGLAAWFSLLYTVNFDLSWDL
jgi:hypothetical protein